MPSVPLAGEVGEVSRACSRSCTKVLMVAINNPGHCVSSMLQCWFCLLSQCLCLSVENGGCSSWNTRVDKYRIAMIKVRESTVT